MSNLTKLANDAAAVVASQNNEITLKSEEIAELKRRLGVDAATIETEKSQTSSLQQSAATAIKNIVSAIVSLDTGEQTQAPAVPTPVTRVSLVMPTTPFVVKPDATD